MAEGTKNRWGLVLVRGRSMLPTFGGARRIALVQYGATPVVGDVAVIDRPDRPGFRVIKRVTDRDQRGWWVESDSHSEAQVNADSWQFGHVTDAQLLGVVRWPKVSRPRA